MELPARIQSGNSKTLCVALRAPESPQRRTRLREEAEAQGCDLCVRSHLSGLRPEAALSEDVQCRPPRYGFYMNQYFKVILYVRFKLCKQIRGKTYNFEEHLIHTVNRKYSSSSCLWLMNLQKHHSSLAIFLFSHRQEGSTKHRKGGETDHRLS